MPPLPSTLDAETAALIAALERRHKDLFDFQIPRLRSCAGPLVTQQQYVAELREDIEAFAKQVQVLDCAVDDQKIERNRRELRAVVDQYREKLSSLRKDARTALLTSKRAIDANKLSNREELLRSSAVREKQDLNEKVAEDALMKTSNDVTEALQRTVTLMQGELERSVLSTQLLDASTASLRSTSSTHDVLSSLMHTSKHLITALEKSDWLDRLLVLAGLAFFLLVVLFILKQRIVDRGLRVAFWWTRFLPSSTSAGVGKRAAVEVAVVEKGGMGAAAQTTSVVVSSAVAAASSTVAAVVAGSTSTSLGVPADGDTLPSGSQTTSLSDILASASGESFGAPSLVSSMPGDAAATTAEAAPHDEL